MENDGLQMAARKRCPQCGREYLEAFLYCKEDGSELEVIVSKQEAIPSEQRVVGSESEKKPTKQAGETLVSAAPLPLASAASVSPVEASKVGLPASRFMAAFA